MDTKRVDQPTVLYIDPPWAYNNRSMNRITKFGGGAMAHYPVMDEKGLIGLGEDISNIAGNNVIMYCWTTGPWIIDSGIIIRKWGFKYATVGFVWNKLNPKALTPVTCPGNHTSSSCEYVLVAVKQPISKQHKPAVFPVPQYKELPRMEHSRKPDWFRQQLEIMYPDHRKIEMFAREQVREWEVHGNETDKFNHDDPTKVVFCDGPVSTLGDLEKRIGAVHRIAGNTAMVSYLMPDGSKWSIPNCIFNDKEYLNKWLDEVYPL